MVNHTQDAIMQGIITCGVHLILNTAVAGVLAMIIGIKLLYLLQLQKKRLKLLQITIQIIHLR